MMETSLLKLVYFIKEIRLLCENEEKSKYLDKLENCGFVLKLPDLVHEFNSVAREINNDETCKSDMKKVIEEIKN